MFEGNPFPGLRPFQFEENYLFFGREEQVSQLLQRLGNTASSPWSVPPVAANPPSSVPVCCLNSTAAL